MYSHKTFLFGLLACALAVAVTGQDRTYSQTHNAKISGGDQKAIDAHFGGESAQDAKLAVMRDRVNLALIQQRQRLSAQAQGDAAAANFGDDLAKARIAEKGSVTADRGEQKVAASGANDRAMAVAGQQNARGNLVRGEDNKVAGGNVQQAGNQANMKNGENDAILTANSRYTANAVKNGNDKFNVRTADSENADSRGAYGLNSESLSKNAGNGLIAAKNTKGQAQYTYKIDQNAETGQGNAQIDQVGDASGVFDRRMSGWKCTAVKDGESVCMDANGKIVGKVISNANGDATVIDNNGVVVGRGRVIKKSEQEYEVVVSDGLAVAKTTKMYTQDCFAEVSTDPKPTEKIVIENLSVKVDGEKQEDGSTLFTWPACFDIEGDVTIPAGVDPSRLAFEYQGHVMPLGSLKCMDSLTCGRECYYCNACEKEKFLGADSQLNVGGNKVCSIHGGGGKQRISQRVCPPAETEKFAFCGGFDRQILGNDYYKYDSSIKAEIRIWLRPEDSERAAIQSQFFQQISIPLVKTGLQNQMKLEQLAQGSAYVPTDMELLNWYMRKHAPDSLLSCERGVVDYSIAGSGVSSNIMIDTFTNLGREQKIQLFSDAPCEQWKAQQIAEYKAIEEAQPKSSLTSALGSLFGGRRG